MAIGDYKSYIAYKVPMIIDTLTLYTCLNETIYTPNLVNSK